MHVYSELGRQRLPKLFTHLEQENLHESMYSIEWFMTIYTRSFRFDLVTRIWDVMLHEGKKIVFRVALALMKVRVCDSCFRGAQYFIAINGVLVRGEAAACASLRRNDGSLARASRDCGHRSGDGGVLHSAECLYFMQLTLILWTQTMWKIPLKLGDVTEIEERYVAGGS